MFSTRSPSRYESRRFCVARAPTSAFAQPAVLAVGDASPCSLSFLYEKRRKMKKITLCSLAVPNANLLRASVTNETVSLCVNATSSLLCILTCNRKRVTTSGSGARLLCGDEKRALLPSIPVSPSSISLLVRCRARFYVSGRISRTRVLICATG